MLCGIQNSVVIGYALQIADSMGMTQEQKNKIKKKMSSLLDHE